MNPEESQTPQPIDESLMQKEEQNPTIENLENSSAEEIVETEAQIPSDETQQDNAVVASAIDEQTEKPIIEVLAQEKAVVATLESEVEELWAIAARRVAEFQDRESSLKEEIANLQVFRKTLQGQVNETQAAMARIVQESLAQLEQRRQALQISVEQLERRQERIRNEMKTTFAGASQDLAIRVQGFKDYLAGSLQDLAASAEQLQLVPPVKEREKSLARETRESRDFKDNEPDSDVPQFAQQQFQDTTKQIRRLIDQYRTKPDYYGSAWQLRRTFEPVHAERVSNWFFTLGGRGALRTMGSRLQNILIASASISILHKLYGDRVRTLVLANTPERLGEWRRGLQDCLGVGRPDFGPDKGIVLFETSDAVAQKAERLVKANQMPFIVIDDSEEQISLGLLQFPLWLAFAPDPKMMRNYDDDF
jgi:Protein of unknown function (DUF3086)